MAYLQSFQNGSVGDVKPDERSGSARIILREVRESRILIISQNDPDIVRRQTLEANVHGLVAKSNIHR